SHVPVQGHIATIPFVWFVPLCLQGDSRFDRHRYFLQLGTDWSLLLQTQAESLFHAIGVSSGYCLLSFQTPIPLFFHLILHASKGRLHKYPLCFHLPGCWH